MPFDDALMWIYRLLALMIATAMAVVVLRAEDWRNQAFAGLVLVPFLLRALGVK